jgi:hypothetical protein
MISKNEMKKLRQLFLKNEKENTNAFGFNRID